MTVYEFIELIKDEVINSCKESNLLPSPTFAQAIIESKYGTSELAVSANALFGIKADKRWNGKTYRKKTSEYINGKYIEVMADFRSYDSWGESIKDHNDFLLVNKRYSNLVGMRDYKEYCKLIKQDGYATSPTYSQTLINCIEKYNLAKYDTETEENNRESEIQKKYVFNIHAGHNPNGMVASGSDGYMNESDENRAICSLVCEKLKNLGHTVYDCTCNNGTSQKDVLQKIVSKCNEHEVDFDVSIHFNAIKKETVSDGKTKGTEVFIFPGSTIKNTAQSICNSIADLGFANRGVKYSDKLYFLKNTKSPAMLIECCFVDDADDFSLYNPELMANAIVKGLTGEKALQENSEAEEESLYYVIAGIHKIKENAEQFSKNLAEKGYLADENGNLIKGIITNIQKMKKQN